MPYLASVDLAALSQVVELVWIVRHSPSTASLRDDACDGLVSHHSLVAVEVARGHRGREPAVTEVQGTARALVWR